MDRKKIAIVYCSRYGHTKKLAECVRDGAEGVPGTEVLFFTTEEAAKVLTQLDAADAVVFGTPTYMGNMASEMKAFLESTVGRWVNRAWADKIAGGFTNSANFSGDKLNTLQGLMVTAMQLGMIWVGVNTLPGANEAHSEDTLSGPSPAALNRNGGSIGPMGCSFNVHVPEAPSPGDCETARLYGQRIASIARRFNKG